MRGGLYGFGRLVVSRVVETGLIIAGGDCVSGLEGSFGGLRVGLSCGVGRDHLGVLGWWPLALAALAWVGVLGLGPGVWALPCAPGGSPSCAWRVRVALGMPQYGWVGAGSGVGLVALGPPMCLQVVFFFFRVMRRAVGWGGAFPLLGAVWVGLGDGGSQARAAATCVTA